MQVIEVYRVKRMGDKWSVGEVTIRMMMWLGLNVTEVRDSTKSGIREQTTMINNCHSGQYVHRVFQISERSIEMQVGPINTT